jgi:hypothetical protein
VLRAFDEHAPRGVLRACHEFAQHAELTAAEARTSLDLYAAAEASVANPVVEAADAPCAALSTAGDMDNASHRPLPEPAPAHAGRPV